MTVVVLYGPKGVGKSAVAEVLRAGRGVAHLDADALVLDLLATGRRPHPEHGWLVEVEGAVTAALQEHPLLSVEATGAWDSDWRLADDLEAAGQQVVRVGVTAPLEVAMSRLGARTTRKVPVSEQEARRTWTAATEQARRRRFDLVIDTGRCRAEDLASALGPLDTVLAAPPRGSEGSS